tara:strand:- start:39 stop:293 length:255 start_codon:yes stop_codon:yes gene_type:complete
MSKRLEQLSKKDLMKKFGSALASGANTNINEYSRNNTKEDVIQDIQGLGLNQGDDFLERKKGGPIQSEYRNGGKVNVSNFKGQF